MEKTKVFIDGQEGTTGLKIFERFKKRDDVEILRIEEDLRKDLQERKKLINRSDFVFLCLPDRASIEAVSLLENPKTRIIDASTAHRTNPSWAYGLPELSKFHRQKIENSSFVAVPGCYAGGFIALIYPLIKSGLMSKNHLVTSYGLSGYSGAGKKTIKIYESDEKTKEMYSPRQYALNLNHKHLAEMKAITGLENTPLFNPIVDDYYSGMLVSVPLFTKSLQKKVSKEEIAKLMAEHYKDEYFIKVVPSEELEGGFLSANTLSDTNFLEIFVLGNDEQVLLVSRLDNLGKGASGAAVQCLNIMMKIDEKTGLI